MKANILFGTLAVACAMGAALAGCKTHQKAPSADAIPFTEAQHYFVRNDVPHMPPAKIGTQEEFEKYFGMAAVMGENGLPTPIDFRKQFVVSVAMPQTYCDTSLEAQSLEKRNGRLVFTYRVRQGERRSYSTVPLLMVVVDKAYDMDVKLNPAH